MKATSPLQMHLLCHRDTVGGNWLELSLFLFMRLPLLLSTTSSSISINIATQSSTIIHQQLFQEKQHMQLKFLTKKVMKQ